MKVTYESSVLSRLTEEEQEEFKRLVDKINTPERWKPESGETYYYVDSDGLVAESDCLYSDLASEMDYNRYSIRNCFKTSEEAVFQAKRIQILVDMQEIADKDEQPEWDGKDNHYLLRFNCLENHVYVDCSSWIKNGGIYFASKERAEECIKQIGEENIKKYYFKIKED